MGEIALQVTMDTLNGKFAGGFVETPTTIVDKDNVMAFLKEADKLYPKPSKILLKARTAPLGGRASHAARLRRANVCPAWEFRRDHQALPRRRRRSTRFRFALQPGEIHGLIGENGCGKSTLIKMLSGAHQPTRARSCEAAIRSCSPDPSAARRGRGRDGLPGVLARADLTVAENIYLGPLAETRP